MSIETIPPFDTDVPEPKAPEKIECTVALDVRDRVRSRIETAIVDQPRTLQELIGPSEIGIDCDLCLGRKLAQIRPLPEISWYSFEGTAVHEKLDRDVFDGDELALSETRVAIGNILDQRIEGTADLYELIGDCVVDWKNVGDSTLSSARKGIVSQQYFVQVHAYGRGFALLGHDVQHVAVYFLPRERDSLDSAVWWAWEYDEQVVLDALARAERIAKRIEIEGAAAVLPTLIKKPWCRECQRYRDEGVGE